MRFEERRVIVTGASRGIGRGIVDAFLDEGAVVLATDVLADGLEALARGHAHAERLAIHPADLSGSTRRAAWSPPRSSCSAGSTCS